MKESDIIQFEKLKRELAYLERQLLRLEKFNHKKSIRIIGSNIESEDGQIEIFDRVLFLRFRQNCIGIVKRKIEKIKSEMESL